MSKNILFLLFSTLIISCASLTKDNVDKISIGMDKSSVLNIIGDPTSTNRENSVDYWIYKYFDGKYKTATQVLFKNGQVIKVADLDPADDETSSYKDYQNKIKNDRKSAKDNFQDLDDN